MQIAKSYKIIDGIIKLYDANGKKIYGCVHLEGDFYCVNNQLTSLVIPEGFTCDGGFYCYSNKLTSLTIPEGFTCGGNFSCYSNKLTSLIIPEGFTCGGNFYCYSNQLTSLVIPEGFTCGGNFSCVNNQLISLIIPEGFTCGGNFSCYSNKLTSLIIPEWVTCGGDFYCYSNQLTGFQSPTPATFNDFFEKGFMFADGVLTKVVHKKGNVYKTKKLASEKIIYVVKDGDIFAHGKTVKAAKLDLAFKKSDRNISDFKGIPLNTTKDPEEWALIYRIITGACQTGTEMFMDGKGKLKKRYTLAEILEETKGAYGSERFKQVVTGE